MSTSVLFYGTGRRKTSVARVWITPGTGTITVNKRTVENYFPVETQRMLLQQPFGATSTSGKYDVRINVSGGGPSGQAGACRHGIARALLASDATFRPLLKVDKLLTRDSRMKERKKYGLRGARRGTQFSKR